MHQELFTAYLNKGVIKNLSRIYNGTFWQTVNDFKSSTVFAKSSTFTHRVLNKPSLKTLVALQSLLKFTKTLSI